MEVDNKAALNDMQDSFGAIQQQKLDMRQETNVGVRREQKTVRRPQLQRTRLRHRRQHLANPDDNRGRYLLSVGLVVLLFLEETMCRVLYVETFEKMDNLIDISTAHFIHFEKEKKLRSPFQFEYRRDLTWPCST